MKTVCAHDLCTGCMACIDKCPKKAIRIEDSLMAYNAQIDESMCVDCKLCYSVCQKNNPPEALSPQVWFQGWAQDWRIRQMGSSGGVATALSRCFIEKGGIVCSCKFINGEFSFDVAQTTAELEKFAGSKYIKSNPTGVYEKVGKLLESKEVLFIGLPCQVAALKKNTKKTLLGNLYTIDLICHGTPSPKLLEVFLRQHHSSLNTLSDIRFRTKGQFQVSDGYRGIITTGVCDSYLLSFLNGVNYTENCYHCDYAKFERVSDITLGDSWGTELKSEMKKGVSLILCQTEKGESLVRKAKLELKDVDIEKAIKNNHQLQHPSIEPKGRKAFLESIRKNRSYAWQVFKLFPKQSIRQLVKMVLIKLRIVGRDNELEDHC